MIPATFELDDNGDATGIVHPYCNLICQRAHLGNIPDPHRAMPTGGEPMAADGCMCECCGKVLAIWTRDGDTVVNSGEISGMDAPPWAIEIVGEDYTGYYHKTDGTVRACFTYYVCRVVTDNQPVKRIAWTIEEVDCFDSLDPEGEVSDSEYSYEGGSALFWDSEESALREAKRMADEDESYKLQ